MTYASPLRMLDPLFELFLDPPYSPEWTLGLRLAAVCFALWLLVELVCAPLVLWRLWRRWRANRRDYRIHVAARRHEVI